MKTDFIWARLRRRSL